MHLKKEISFFIILGLLAAIVFAPGFNIFFHQDDFVHASFSKTPMDVINAFNIFKKAAYPYFRPVSTQTYWFITQNLFAKNYFLYHLTNFSLLLLNAVLIFILEKALRFSKRASLAATVFYTLNATHVAPMFSSAYVQELLLVTFSTLSLIFFCRKKTFLTLLCFFLALASKETALVLPALYLLIEIFMFKRKSLMKTLKLVIFIGVLTLFYLFVRLNFYGIPESSSYHLMLGKGNVNALVWYLLWALSLPNILVDFIGPGLKINPVLFKVSAGFLPGIFIGFLSFMVLTLLAVIKLRPIKLLIFTSFWFIIGVLPLIIFPWHHLAVEQTLSLVGLSLFLGFLVARTKYLGLGMLIAFIFLNLNTVRLAEKTHWVANGGRISEKVYVYLKKQSLKPNSVLYFKDGKILIPAYGSSRQISLAMGGDRGFKFLFGPEIKVYFEADTKPPKNRDIIYIDSSKFLYQ